MFLWRLQRDQQPHLFDPGKVRVWQQPDGSQDEITMKWFTELIMEFFPQSVWHTDLLACSLTPVSKTALSLAHVLPAWNVGGVAPVAQLPQL